jgi:hypothetical protein
MQYIQIKDSQVGSNIQQNQLSQIQSSQKK